MKVLLIILSLLSLISLNAEYYINTANSLSDSFVVQNSINNAQQSEENNQIIIFNNCKEILDTGNSIGDGNYNILNNGVPEEVYCDMTTDGGGKKYFSNNGINISDLTFSDSVVVFSSGIVGVIRVASNGAGHIPTEPSYIYYTAYDFELYERL